MIGKGNFAKVYLAKKKSQNSDEQYAVKAFNKEYILSQNKGLQGLTNEIQIMQQLNHNNIIKLYHVYESQHSIYLVLELVSGGEMISKYQDSKSVYTFHEIKEIMRQLLLAIAHLHERQIIHRDLKPENLLVKSKEQKIIKIADFGLSHQMTDIKPIFTRCGTPGFVAPEILVYSEEKPFYNEKCDLFSIGVIFFILLTGKQPFYASEFKQILRLNKQCQVDYEMPQLKKVSNNAIDLLKKLLEASPLKRISAEDALKHNYFGQTQLIFSSQSISELGSNQQIQISQSNLQSFNKNLNIKEEEKVSGLTDSIDQLMYGDNQLVQNQQILNGRVDTFNQLMQSNSIGSLRMDPQQNNNEQSSNKLKTIKKKSQFQKQFTDSMQNQNQSDDDGFSNDISNNENNQAQSQQFQQQILQQQQTKTRVSDLQKIALMNNYNKISEQNIGVNIKNFNELSQSEESAQISQNIDEKLSNRKNQIELNSHNNNLQQQNKKNF